MFTPDYLIPPQQKPVPDDHRPVNRVIMAPHIQFYAPDELTYPSVTVPTVPGDGGYVSMGANMVLYCDGNIWNRGDQSLAGPVKEFFHRMMGGRNSVKHT